MQLVLGKMEINEFTENGCLPNLELIRDSCDIGFSREIRMEFTGQAVNFSIVYYSRILLTQSPTGHKYLSYKPFLNINMTD